MNNVNKYYTPKYNCQSQINSQAISTKKLLKCQNLFYLRSRETKSSMANMRSMDSNA